MASKRKKSDKKMNDKLDAKFSEMYGERFGDERITQMNVADANLEYSQLFGANKNLYRTIASLIDGCKPGKRRLLYTWWLLENKPMSTDKSTLNKLKFIKVNKLSANTGNLHPHAVTAVEELIGREGQYWNNNVMLLVPQGNYGNCRNEEPGNGRYIEAKLSEFAIDCFFDDFEMYCIPMKVAYDGETLEPEFFPSKYPSVLFNPQFSGIGYGLASNIPSFNVTEVLDATIKLIKDRDTKIMLIPDSPTGCDIIDEGLFKDINKTGQSKVTFRASSEIDYANNIIKITSLPINSMSQGVIDSIISLKEKKQFDDIIEIKDYTKEGEVYMEIYLKPDAKPERILKQLYKKGTGLKSTFPVGLTVIDDYCEYEYGVKDLLLAWIDYRIDAVRSMLLNKLQIMLSKEHMNNVLLMVFNKDNIDRTVSIAKTSKSRKETIERLMKEFNISSVQAATIADMHVYSFNEDSYNRYKEDEDKIKQEIDNINEILLSDDNLEEFIIKQLEEGKRKYGRPRMSKVVKENDKSNDDIPDTEHLIGISETGFIKKLTLKNNSAIGHVGNTNSNITVLQVNNRENLLVIDSKGNVTKVSISAIPDMAFEDIGLELNKFFNVKGNVKAVMELPSMDILKVKDENLCIIFITKKGLAKKVQISEFSKLTDTKLGITLNKDDEVAAALFALKDGSKEIIISTNMGDGIRLSLNDIPNNGIVAKGISMIKLKENEEIIMASLMNPKKKFLFLLTSSGRGKVVETKYFPTMNRKDTPLPLIQLVGNENLLGISSVDKNDKIMISRKKGESETIDIKSIEVGTRISKGEKIITPGKGDTIVSYKVFSSK